MEPSNHAKNGIGTETSGDRLVDEFAQLNLEDLLGLARVYHYDMIYFRYEFDHDSYFISGFE